MPFGIVITRAMGLGDLRQIGSGNIGATNVLRTGQQGGGGRDPDPRCGKGAVAVLVARADGGRGRGAAGGGCRLPRPLLPGLAGFKGGKGVATFLGILLALAWPLGLPPAPHGR